MSLFKNYCSGIGISNTSGLLEIVKKADHYVIFDQQHPLMTPGGNTFEHKSEFILQFIATSLMLGADGASATLSPYNFFAFQRDILEQGSDPFISMWEEVISSDPFVRLKTTGKTGYPSFPPDHPLFNFSYIMISSLVRSINGIVNESMRDYDLSESEAHPFTELIRVSYMSLSLEQKTILQALSYEHGAGIVLPLGLVLGLIHPSGYVNGLIALNIQPAGKVLEMRQGALNASDYLASMDNWGNRDRDITSFIADGESDTLEFKSTLRWDIRAGKTNQAIERACLKSISAFLNTNGGTLLIGVKDDGSIEGIETDKFVNEDKFLLHLWTLIRTCLGRDVSPSVQTSLEKVDGKTVCIVRCARNTRPVFLRQPGFPEEFFIRLGPASNAMDISEALKYIHDHFPAA